MVKENIVRKPTRPTTNNQSTKTTLNSREEPFAIRGWTESHSWEAVGKVRCLCTDFINREVIYPKYETRCHELAELLEYSRSSR